MTEGEAPNPDVPKGPDTLGDPTLIEADETLTRIAEAEGRQQDRMENHNLIFKMVEASLTKVTDKIAEEQKKSSPDYGRLAELSARQKSLTEKRDEMKGRADKKADEKEKAVASDMTASAKELEGDLVKMKELHVKKTALEAQLTPGLLASTVPAEIAKKEAVYGQLKEVDKALKKYEKQGGYEDQQASAEGQKAMARKAMAMTEAADHEAEMAVVEAELQAYIDGTDTPKRETAKPAEGAAANNGERPLTAEQKEVLLDNKIDQIAFDLAKLLATNVPTKDDTFGRYGFEAKRGLLIVLSYFGEDAGWANQLSPAEQKALAMTVTTEAGADGKPVTSIKWEKLEFSVTKVQKVYEMAFGKEGWAKEMEGLRPTTKLSDLQDRVSKFKPETQDKNELAMIKFVKTLEDLGAVPESGVQSFITINADRILKVYDPETAATSSDGADKDNESPEFNVDNVVKIIGDNKFHKKTSYIDMIKAIDPKSAEEAELSPEAITTKAKVIVAGFKTTEDLTTYQASFREGGKIKVLLGITDTSAAMEATFAKALTELKAGKIEAATKTDLQNGIEAELTLLQAYLNSSYYDILKKERAMATGQDLTDIETMMDALEQNPVPGESAPAAPAPGK